MTVLEYRIATALQQCRFLPGSFDKRFVNQLTNWTKRDLTVKGRAKLIEMLHKYRRQIPEYSTFVSELNGKVKEGIGNG
jgi:hypothetical protein